METYVLDASALIDLDRHFQATGLRRVGRLAQEGRTKIPDGVYRELRRKTDKLFKTVEQWANKNGDCIVHIGRVHDLVQEVIRVEQQYGEQIVVGTKAHRGFWHSPAGTKAADGQVIATAKVLGATVVSDDRAVCLACMLESVPCIGWTEFARRIHLLTQLKLPSME